MSLSCARISSWTGRLNSRSMNHTTCEVLCTPTRKIPRNRSETKPFCSVRSANEVGRSPGGTCTCDERKFIDIEKSWKSSPMTGQTFHYRLVLNGRNLIVVLMVFPVASISLPCPPHVIDEFNRP